MTRKDYELVAQALNSTQLAEVFSLPHFQQWTADVEAVADALAADNDRFDRERFLAACRGDN